MAGLGCKIASFYLIYITLKADMFVFKLRWFYIYAIVLLLGGMHIMLFPSNPLPPKAKGN